MGCGSLSSRTLFGSLAVPAIIFLFLVGTLQQTDGRKTKMTLTTTTMNWSGKAEHGKAPTGWEKALVHPQLEINYLSKRKVPGGPDPIHNRNAGNSNQPPGTH
ncbi:hypothetical protein SLE2022_202390 [Rubroshorea leprosula]